MNKKYKTVGEMCDITGLRMSWIIQQAKGGKLPYLLVGKRMMFDPDVTLKAISAMNVLHHEGGED